MARPPRVEEWSDLVFSLCQLVDGVAAAFRRRASQDGGFLGAVRSAFSCSLSAWGHD